MAFRAPLRINPRGDGSRTGRRAHRARYSRQANAAAAGLHIHRPGNVHHANTAAARLRMHRAPHFPEINLPAPGFYADEFSRLADRDVSAFGRQLRFAADARRANVPAARFQIGFAQNVSCVDVAAPAVKPFGPPATSPTCTWPPWVSSFATSRVAPVRPLRRTKFVPIRPQMIFPPCVPSIAVPPISGV